MPHLGWRNSPRDPFVRCSRGGFNRAGDAFTATFLQARMRGWSMLEAALVPTPPEQPLHAASEQSDAIGHRGNSSPAA